MDENPIAAWTCSEYSSASLTISPSRAQNTNLHEARRLLADLDTPPSLAAALRFDAWLRNEAIANDTDRVPVKRIYPYDPHCVRNLRSPFSLSGDGHG